MIAVISGASGLVGSALLTKLLADNSIHQVISVTRKNLGFNHPKLKEVIISDFSNLKDYASELKGDFYFCSLGTTIKTAGNKENFKKVDHDAVVSFGEVAKINNAQTLSVVSANMADPNSSIFYNQVKGQTEETLIKLDLDHLNIFRPGLLIGERLERRSSEKIAIQIFKVISPILPIKIRKSIGTPIEVLANKMISSGLHPNKKVNIISAVEI